MSSPAEIPASWAPWLPIFGTVIRGILYVAGSAGITWAQAVTASQVQQMVGLAAIVIAGMWGIVQKQQANRAIQQAAAQSPRMTPPALPV